MREEGLEVDQLDLGANTPLHLAARAGHTATTATLLNLGASVHAKVTNKFHANHS
jgi:ankyrin repeat protein